MVILCDEKSVAIFSASVDLSEVLNSARCDVIQCVYDHVSTA